MLPSVVCSRPHTYRGSMGVTASTVASRNEWPAAGQIAQLRLQLQLLHAWAMSGARAAAAFNS